MHSENFSLLQVARLEGYEPGEDEDVQQDGTMNEGDVSKGSMDKDAQSASHGGTQSASGTDAKSHPSQLKESLKIPDTKEDVANPADDVPSGSGGHSAQCHKVFSTVPPKEKDDLEPTNDTEEFKTAPSNTTNLKTGGNTVGLTPNGALKSRDDTLSPTIPVKYAIEQLREGRDHAAIRRELAQISSERVCEDDEMARVYRKRMLHSTPFCTAKRQCSSIPLVVSSPQEFNQPDPWLNGILNPPILGQKVPSNSWFSKLFRK